MTLYRRNLGKLGEQKAVNYLLKSGFTILKKNFKTNLGEIDIIARKNKIIYFIEVKTRTSLNKGLPWESVSRWKINNIKKTAEYFLLKYRIKNYKLKLGIISILMIKNSESLKFYEDIEGR